jgi:hypothetical protein
MPRRRTGKPVTELPDAGPLYTQVCRTNVRARTPVTRPHWLRSRIGSAQSLGGMLRSSPVAPGPRNGKSRGEHDLRNSGVSTAG